MRAVVTQTLGSPPTLIELDTPEPGPGQIRIKVTTASMNGFDNALAAGYLNGMIEHAFPVVLGRDFAGTVDMIGEGVTAYSIGDSVFGVVITQPLAAGSFAEYLVIPEDHNVARIPDGLDEATAGVIGLAGAAAIATLDATSTGAGDSVLISGATGGVGAFAVQMAKARGATVIATAANDAEASHVRALGADHVVRPADLTTEVRAIAPTGVDVAIHLAGDPVALGELVADGGRFCSLLSSDPQQGERIAAPPTYATPHNAVLVALGGDVAAGRLQVPVQREYDLADVPQMFADFNAGTIGKLKVRVA